MAFDVVSLGKLLDAYPQDKIREQLSSFTSINDDVQHFIRDTAIQFQKIGLSRTTLVYTTIKGEMVLAGYFSISSKPLTISKKNWSHLSKSVQRKLMPIGYHTAQNNYEVSSILLGQIGKNFEYVDQHVITGEQLLALAYKEIKRAWEVVGGTMLYLEAKNEPHLRDFYVTNGFSQLLMKKQEDDKKPTIPYVSPNKLHLYVKKLSDI